MELQTIITLLTITVMLLSSVMIVLLGILVFILFKLSALLRRADHIMDNVAKVSDWITPAASLGKLFAMFRK